MNSNDGVKAYETALLKALEKCQHIELVLQECILLAMSIPSVKLSHLPFKDKQESVRKSPLGKLIKIYSSINTDENLQEALEKIKKDRNYVAHQSYDFTLGDLQDVAQLTKNTFMMKEIATRATDVHNRLLDSRYKLLRLLRQEKRLENI
jgi:hypothetical protein